MGKIKYLRDIEELFKKSPVVSYNSIARIIEYKSKKRNYTKRLINYLLKKGTIKSLTKGYYTVSEESPLIVFCFKPSYLGLQDALSFYDLWEQETIPVVITTRNVRQGIREVFGVNVFLRRIDPKYFFGFEYKQDGDFYYPYSDIEKTFIDMIYFKQPLDREVIKNFKKRIDKKKLKSYLRYYPKKFRNSVLKVLMTTARKV